MILAAVVIFLALGMMTGCASLPPKPKGILWTIDWPRTQLIGAPIGGVDPDKMAAGDVQNYVQKSTTRRLPLDQADRFICFSPDTWNAIDGYVKQLREIAQRQCSGGAQ